MTKKHKKKSLDHSCCACDIQKRGPHWGLFCIPHGHWFKWLGKDELKVLREIDIPWITTARPAASKTLQNNTRYRRMLNTT